MTTLYDLVGGEPFFVQLVEDFYQGVENDPLLRPMYPDDLEGAKRRLHLFLMQYWGGPTTYSEERGHPRLRGRHMPFSIGLPERDAWMRHMTASLQAAEAPAEAKEVMLKYFEDVATFMINRAD
jgi:hemoglobin